jgi:Sap, sulfolipid-1-addressing protein
MGHLVQLLFLALEAALYPTLLAAVVILLAQPRPRALLAAYYVGGMVMSVGLGLVIVFAAKSSGVLDSPSSGPSWTVDLGVGGLALLAAVALAVRADERMRARRARSKAARGKGKQEEKKEKDDREPWSERILARGSVPIVFAAGLAINVPGAAYLIALKDIASYHYSTGVDVLLILAFNLIMFLLAEIPLAGLFLAPERTDEMVDRMNRWLSGHSRQIAIGLLAVLGVFLVARGVIDS